MYSNFLKMIASAFAILQLSFPSLGPESALARVLTPARAIGQTFTRMSDETSLSGLENPIGMGGKQWQGVEAL